jgi:hypothetical protein
MSGFVDKLDKAGFVPRYAILSRASWQRRGCREASCPSASPGAGAGAGAGANANADTNPMRLLLFKGCSKAAWGRLPTRLSKIYDVKDIRGVALDSSPIKEGRHLTVTVAAAGGLANLQIRCKDAHDAAEWLLYLRAAVQLCTAEAGAQAAGRPCGANE